MGAFLSGHCYYVPRAIPIAIDLFFPRRVVSL